MSEASATGEAESNGAKGQIRNLTLERQPLKTARQVARLAMVIRRSLIDFVSASRGVFVCCSKELLVADPGDRRPVAGL
jgi:hypothetical protein